MSQENVEIIRRGYEHWMATGEFRAHADLVWDVSNLGWPDQQIYHGPEGAMHFNAEWADAWDDWELEVEDYIDAGERVVVILNQRGRSKATGIPVDMRFAQVWTLRDGQGIRMQLYASVEEALEAVGLSGVGPPLADLWRPDRGLGRVGSHLRPRHGRRSQREERRVRLCAQICRCVRGVDVEALTPLGSRPDAPTPAARHAGT